MRDDINYNKIIDDGECAAAQAAADAADGVPADQIVPSSFYVTQLYDKYSQENHDVWRDLYDRRWEKLEEQASRTFINGLNAINLVRDHVPNLTRINSFLQPLTGWQSRAVPGYLPAKAFFACLASREFPTTITIRPKELMDYLPEPDIFHDIFGHVPLHADPVFADFLQTYGKAALEAETEQQVVELQRIFWFTVEFGLIREDDRLKIYGSGLISSHGEAEHSLQSDKVERRPFDIDAVVATDFEIDHYQPILYVLDSFQQLREEMNRYAGRVLGWSAAGSAV